MSTINLQFIEQVNKLLAVYPASSTRLISTPRHNASIGGAKLSKHVMGEAIDLVFDDVADLLKAAKLAKTLKFGGIEIDYKNNHLHLDNRSTVWHVVCTTSQTYTLDDYLTRLENGSITNFSI